MIRGVHTMFFSSQPDELRDFIRDKLSLRATDVGGGWLIFDVPEADIGVHPTAEGGAPSGAHNISFYCDDLEATVAELKEKGVEFTDEIQEVTYGKIIHFTMPGDVAVQLYQPNYEKKF